MLLPLTFDGHAGRNLECRHPVRSVKEPEYIIDFFYFFVRMRETSLSLIPTTESNPARLADPKSPAPRRACRVDQVMAPLNRRRAILCASRQ